MLETARIAAINFHPAPVEYPGSGCINWALYDNASHYGVTAHLMAEKVDSGPVIECRRFAILPEDGVASLLARTHAQAFALLADVTTGLARGGQAYLQAQLAAARDERWRGPARRIRDLDALQRIDPACTREELERIIRATYVEGFPPEIRLHGYRFILHKEAP